MSAEQEDKIYERFEKYYNEIYKEILKSPLSDEEKKIYLKRLEEQKKKLKELKGYCYSLVADCDGPMCYA